MMGYKGEIKCFQTSELALSFMIEQMINKKDSRFVIDMIIADVVMPIISGLEMI